MSAAFPSRWLLRRSIARPSLAYIAIAVGSGNRRMEPRSGVRFGETLDEENLMSMSFASLVAPSVILSMSAYLAPPPWRAGRDLRDGRRHRRIRCDQPDHGQLLEGGGRNRQHRRGHPREHADVLRVRGEIG